MEQKDFGIVTRFYFQDGNRLYPENGYDKIIEVRDRTSIFIVTLNGKKGLVNKQNKVILYLEYDWIGDTIMIIQGKFYLRVAKKISEGVWQKGIIHIYKECDEWKSAFVVPCKWAGVELLQEKSDNGWFKISNRADKAGLANVITGSEINPEFDIIKGFEHGLAPVGIIRKKTRFSHICGVSEYYWGMVDEDGTVVIPIAYSKDELKKKKTDYLTGK